MVNYLTVAAAVASTLIRAFSYVFLRWIPGHHFPPLILTAAAVYFASFVRLFLTTSPFEVVSDEVEIVTRKSTNENAKDRDGLIEGASDGPLEELDVTETVVLEPTHTDWRKTLLWGLPNPLSLPLTLLTAGVNLALVLFTLDLVYHAPLRFDAQDLVLARVGYVSHNSARILVREPRDDQLPLSLRYRLSPVTDPGSSGRMVDTAWKSADKVKALSDATDFTTHLEISSLSPDTLYQWILSNNKTGTFTTAPKPGNLPSRRNNTYTFLFTSCIKARTPYNPLSHPLSVPGLTHLSNLLPSLKPQFMMFMGDFIYIDVPHRFGSSAPTYRAEYRRTYASPSWQDPAAHHLPWLHVIDDHEIANDWDRNVTGLFRAAQDPFNNYHAAANPPPAALGATYAHFVQGPLAVFMLETRRYRSPESKNTTDPAKTMLGLPQRDELLRWIRTPPPRGVKWRVIVSSVPFTTNWRFGDTDTWGTYLHERSLILDAIYTTAKKHGVRTVVVSGDRHEFAATKIHRDSALAVPYPPLKGHTAPVLDEADTVVEFSVSPLSMFYLPVRSYHQRDSRDEEIAYIPKGNSKFGAIEISNDKETGKSALHFRLFVDGKERWTYDLQGL